MVVAAAALAWGRASGLALEWEWASVSESAWASVSESA